MRSTAEESVKYDTVYICGKKTGYQDSHISPVGFLGYLARHQYGSLVGTIVVCSQVMSDTRLSVRKPCASHHGGGTYLVKASFVSWHGAHWMTSKRVAAVTLISHR